MCTPGFKQFTARASWQGAHGPTDVRAASARVHRGARSRRPHELGPAGSLRLTSREAAVRARWPTRSCLFYGFALLRSQATRTYPTAPAAPAKPQRKKKKKDKRGEREKKKKFGSANDFAQRACHLRPLLKASFPCPPGFFVHKKIRCIFPAPSRSIRK